MHREGKSMRKRLTILALVVGLLGLPALAGAPVLGAPPVGPDKLADFEAGLPANWFTFFGGSTVTTTPLAVGETDALARPAQTGDNGILQLDFNVSDFGGLGGDFVTSGPQDWSTTDGFSFWFYGTGSGLGYQAEISDNRSDPSVDTSERFDYVFVDDTAGWKRIFIPWSDFTRATDFQPGGAPDDGFTLTEVYAWAIVLPLGADTVYFDDFGVENLVIDDFEGFPPGPLPSGIDAAQAGVQVGYFTFQGASSAAIAAESTPPAPESFEFGSPNGVIKVDLDVTDFAGFIHNFSNDTYDTWVSQDWTAYEGFAVWIYGQNSGTSMFIDLVENLNPEADPGDTAERWTVTLTDDFSGWRYFEFPFNEFVRKGIGNNAPNDGLTLDEVHGWAFGTLGTPGPVTFYLDGATLFGSAAERPLLASLSSGEFNIPEGETGQATVKLSRPMTETDPEQVSVDFVIEPGLATPGRDFVATGLSGTLTFVRGGASDLPIPFTTIDDAKYEGDERAIVRITNPVDVGLGGGLVSSLRIVDDDPIDPTLIDDFERFPYLWDASSNVGLGNPEFAAGDPDALPGQGAYEGVLSAAVLSPENVEVQGRICNEGSGVIQVKLQSTENFDATAVDHTTVRLGDAYETHVDGKTGEPKRHEAGEDLIFHFRFDETGLECDPEVVPFTGLTYDGRPIAGSFWRDFPIGQDWSLADGVKFWYHGANSGHEVALTLKDNRAPDPGPAGWNLVWADEFNDAAGTPPDPANWGYEIGDGTVNGIPGWGNSELQYYTDSTDNAATDGAGNLVLTAQEHTGSLECWYGPCEYTSARLISLHRAEFAYGRIEARVKTPEGAGLWPAFWSLGTDIGEVGWPQTGEIDIMEFVGREPFEVFGTIHGPGYNGGSAFGNIQTLEEPVPENFHTFTIEWGPDEIHWYVDGINYHNAVPADVAPNEWVFNHPFFLIMNVAVGGSFGGPVGEDTTFPQEMIVDYVRVYQGPDTAERWEATFVDDFTGWQQVMVPFDSFTRSAAQPAGAPDDGLGLTEVWGYGFALEDVDASGTLMIDQVRLIAPEQVTVTNTNDAGPGSLRQAVQVVAAGGSIDFDPGLAGETITLTTGPLVVGKSISIDGSSAPGITVSGGNVDRVLIVDPIATAGVSHLTLTEGYGWQLAGCVLNNGSLTLDHVTVTGCTMDTDAGDFWQGGGGIYTGDGASLNLIDSTVADNTAAWSGGGVYGFFNTTTVIERSTISGNVSNDVGGGIRSLGNAEIVNSTISGNESTGWYGGAAFITDGVVNMVNTTVADNVSPTWAAADVFVGTFTDASATLTLTNSIVSSAQDNCFFAPWGAGTVTLTADHNNVFTDATCFAGATDLVVADAGLDSLADNGGPTWTQALLLGSPAIDAADGAACPATDQRGVTRPQGAGCDVGSYELVP
jgi:beta-glucanase (GH16 family)